ncbi:OsmC family protein [Flavobacterium humi]|uniref:OsmC family peroxiredoxin n=1 Tax=Flavobacterium humi TaxID=2562683 RepID=A0A4Z0L5Z8_9FLAO|nr:OsmC family protein [Flavobacterium humi]TGD57393.1 OsmC family peroxiredoxin [Flavobacterium humi]
MSNTSVHITGFSENSNQFVVQSQGFNVRISNHISNGNTNDPSPAEFLLAGFAGSINAVGKIVAKELGIELESLFVEISGELQTKKAEGLRTRSRAGFRKIEVVVKPISDAPLGLLKQWIDEVKERCPLRDNLINATPVQLTLLKEFKAA